MSKKMATNIQNKRQTIFELIRDKYGKWVVSEDLDEIISIARADITICPYCLEVQCECEGFGDIGKNS